MPAVWRMINRTLAAGVVGASLCLGAAAHGDGWDPLAFQMILDTSSNDLGPITYNPAFAGVQQGFMPGDVLGADHPFADFFGQGVSWSDLPAWSESTNGNYDYNFKGYKSGLSSDDTDGFHVWWDVDVRVDPAVSVSLLMSNPTPFAQTFTLTVPLITGPIGPSSLMKGSASGTAADTNGNGGSLAAMSVPGYQAWIDAPGNVVQTLIPTGTTFVIGSNSTATVGPVAFGPAVAGPAVANSIGLTLTFTLSAFDTAIVNGVFEVVQVPGPGALPMLAIAGLVGVRRRRRA